MSSEQKKQSTIVHKPFLTGQVNIFNPPKANPNGRLASAKLLTKDTKKRGNNFPFEQINQQTEDNFNPWESDNASSESNHFIGKKTIFIAIAVVVVANTSSAIIISNNKQKTQMASESAIEQTSPSQVGNMDLSSQEFIKLKASNLSSLPQPTTNENLDLNQSETDPLTTLPLAIPPLNMAQSSNPFTPQSLAQYYYILSEYTGDRSLALAREKVPNVSLITLEEGVFIYMGAFGHKELAQQFLDKLKKEGFYAYMYPSDH
ncbi:MAG: hypothetical protein AAGA80_09770 [Cyanobacteria bacterium P01_F01_bin.143]